MATLNYKTSTPAYSEQTNRSLVLQGEGSSAVRVQWGEHQDAPRNFYTLDMWDTTTHYNLEGALKYSNLVTSRRILDLWKWFLPPINSRKLRDMSD